MTFLKTSITTVNGSIETDRAGIMDAHNHVWIEAIQGAQIPAPVLNDFDAISAELIDFRLAGGNSILDCQPGGCGRNGNVLRQLSNASGVNLVACTGFHRLKYYPQGYWLSTTTVQAACTFFIGELTENLHECVDEQTPVRAGFIKIACEDSLDRSPIHLLEAAVAASLATGAAVQAHTERGQDAERIVKYLFDSGLPPSHLIISHLDKRPDFGLHSSLVQEGVLLEYDTFYRSKYQPDTNLWPLISHMVEAGLEGGIALATDMAETQFWSHLGGNPGLTGLIKHIIPRLKERGHNETTIQKLTGRNIAQRISRI